MTDEDVIGMVMDAQHGRITATQLADKIVERCKAVSQATIAHNEAKGQLYRGKV